MIFAGKYSVSHEIKEPEFERILEMTFPPEETEAQERQLF